MELSSTPHTRTLVAMRVMRLFAVAVSHGGAVIVTGDVAVTCALMSLGCVCLIHLS
jgi:hypothetical protein